MAEASVSMVLNRLAPMIEKKVREEVGLLLNANKEAETLRSKLKKIQEVLMDAEQKGVVDPKVKSWLEKLQDISYDIDEVLDDWDLDNLRRQFEDASESSDTIWEKVSSFLQSLCLCFKQSVERRSIALNVKQLNERLDLIAQENENEFKFIPNLSHHSQDFRRIISTSSVVVSTSSVVVSEVEGRDDDLETLMDNLLNKKSEDDIQIVSIVGAGGMGKTTLAQLAFNRIEIQSVNRSETQFDVKIWVCVSDPFDEIKIAKAILEDLTRKSSDLSQLETLLQCIKDSILEKKFLLVLDDVWTGDDTMWKPLKTSLINNGAPGSRILVTTRNTRVAQVFGSTQIQSLAPLSDDHCWLVLSRKAFLGKSDGDCAMLKATGMEIAKKCKGLPLAAMTMGGVLNPKTSLQEWENVLGSKMWELEDMRTGLFPFLALSYNELHPAVKRCFSYCAIFPKDFKIDVDELIRIWMSQGFLPSDGTVGDMEIKGREYFKDLAMRSFFQDFEKDKSNNNHVKYCKMHDIMHYFAQLLTKNECLIVEGVDGEAKEERVSGQKAQHLNLVKCGAKTTVHNLFSISPIKKLCSLFCTASAIRMDLLSHLKRVRLLSLQSCNLLDIPSEIGNLIHLRYLDLSANDLLVKLPETICDLYNLQTLNLAFCRRLLGLPQEIHKLVNLRHLLVLFTSVRFECNGGFDKLKNLQTLDFFICGKAFNKSKLGYLKDLNQLRGSVILRIGDLDDESDVIEAEKADLKQKKFIQDLSLEYVGITMARVIEALQPHPSLLTLRILGPQLPKWIATLNNLRRLNIECERIEVNRWHSLSSIPFLEFLAVKGLRVKHLGLEFLGINKTAAAMQTVSAFPKLKILRFWFCDEWEEWEDISEEYENSILPCLEELVIFHCLNLKSLPHLLLRKASSLKKLYLGNSSTLEKRYLKGSGRDWDKISHIPYVHM